MWGLWGSRGSGSSASFRFFREVCSIRFLLTALSLLSLFLAGEGVANPLGPPPWMFWSQTRHIFSCIPQHPEHLQLLTVPFRAPSRLFSPHCPFMPRKPSPLAPPETIPLSPALWWGLLYLVPPLENVSQGVCILGWVRGRVREPGGFVGPLAWWEGDKCWRV